MNIRVTEKGQAAAPITVKLDSSAFSEKNETAIYWLGGGGAFINSRGTNIMADPVLEGFDMPLLIDPPILPEEVPSLDAVLITHTDNDHFSRPACRKLMSKCKSFHATGYAAEVMQNKENIPAIGHSIGDSFDIGNVNVKLTPALHNWQNESEEFSYRKWLPEDCCGYYLDTPDGSVWLVGDSKLISEQLKQKEPDAILFDFSDNPWHITFEGALKLAETYPSSELILIHWGTVDAYDQSPFNADPRELVKKIHAPSRVHILAAGEKFILNRRK